MTARDVSAAFCLALSTSYPGLTRLDPGIHVVLGSEIEDVDGRDKLGHDDAEKLQP
jgi:hypothetical protein